MAARVICIARLRGAGGDDIGRMVAEALRFRLVDEEIVQRAAEAEGVDVAELTEVERRRGVLERLLGNLAAGAAADWYGAAALPMTPPPQDPRSLRSLIQQSIHETADEGEVVIVSHAASFALAGRTDVLRVLVTASPETRIARVSELSNVDRKQATKAVEDDDAGRADYLKRFYGVGAESPSHYDLVLNTGTLHPELVVDLVARAAGAT